MFFLSPGQKLTCCGADFCFFFCFLLLIEDWWNWRGFLIECLILICLVCRLRCCSRETKKFCRVFVLDFGFRNLPLVRCFFWNFLEENKKGGALFRELKSTPWFLLSFEHQNYWISCQRLVFLVFFAFIYFQQAEAEKQEALPKLCSLLFFFCYEREKSVHSHHF